MAPENHRVHSVRFHGVTQMLSRQQRRDRSAILESEPGFHSCERSSYSGAYL